MSVVTASGSGGNEFGQREIQNAVGQGPELRRRLPVDRLVLRGDHRPDLDPHGMKGPCGVVVAGGRRRPGRARGTRAGRSGAASTSSSRGGTEAPIGPYALACQLRNGRPQRERRPGRRVPAVRRGARTATCPGEGGAILIVEDAGARRGARRAAGLRRDRRLRRDDRRLPPRQARAGRRPQLARAMTHRARRRRRRPGRRRRRLRRRGRRARGGPRGGRGDQGGLRRARRRAGHGAEDDDRPPVRRRRAARRGDRAARDARRRDPADDQPRRARPRAATWTS